GPRCTETVSIRCRKVGTVASQAGQPARDRRVEKRRRQVGGDAAQGTSMNHGGPSTLRFGHGRRSSVEGTQGFFHGGAQLAQERIPSGFGQRPRLAVVAENAKFAQSVVVFRNGFPTVRSQYFVDRSFKDPKRVQ